MVGRIIGVQILEGMNWEDRRHDCKIMQLREITYLTYDPGSEQLQ